MSGSIGALFCAVCRVSLRDPYRAFRSLMSKLLAPLPRVVEPCCCRRPHAMSRCIVLRETPNRVAAALIDKSGLFTSQS